MDLLRHVAFLLFFLTVISSVGAQDRTCSTMENLQMLLQQDSQLLEKMETIERFTKEWIATHSNGSGSRSLITIPVVVHVLYSTSVENISDEQIFSQIEVLNEDFRRLNSDAVNTLLQFTGIAADCEIEFCLASVGPDGNATEGITRTQTATPSFYADNRVKFSAHGGKDAWPASDYLNIWVCDLNNLLGYGQFPGGSPSTDGVVVDYMAFGSTGYVFFPFNLGRTASHEIGHWLNLRHIWGDGDCSIDDGISDTPLADGPNYGCPLAHFSCGSLNMVQNFMDYSNDACMNLFTTGQKLRMQALFASGGARNSLLFSSGCNGILPPPPPPPPLACGVPADLEAITINSTTIQLTWSAVANATRYNLRIKAAASPSWITINTTFPNIYVSGLAPSGSYQFSVQAQCDSATSAFTSVLNFNTGVASCPEAFEPNDTRGDAKSLQWNSSLRAQISSAGDTDWYRFGTSKSLRNLKITLTDLPEDYNLALYSSSGKLLGESLSTGTTNEMIIHNGAYLGTFYIKVYGNYGAHNTDLCYDLHLSIRNSTFRDDESPELFTFREALDNSLSRIFPNPADEQITVDFFSAEESKIFFNIFDLTGRTVHSSAAEAAEGANSFVIPTHALSSGLYLLQLNDGKELHTQRFLVK